MRMGYSDSACSTGMLLATLAGLHRPSFAVAVGAAAPGPRHQLVVDVRRPVVAGAAEDDEGVAALAGGHHPVGQQAGEGAQHRVHEAEAGDAAHGGGRRHGPVHHRSLGSDDLQGPEHARRVRHLPAQHRAHAQPHHRGGEGEGVVQGAAHLGRRAGEVGRQPVPVDGDLHLQAPRGRRRRRRRPCGRRRCGCRRARRRSRRAPDARCSRAGRRRSAGRSRGRSGRSARGSRVRPCGRRPAAPAGRRSSCAAPARSPSAG